MSVPNWKSGHPCSCGGALGRDRVQTEVSPSPPGSLPKQPLCSGPSQTQSSIIQHCVLSGAFALSSVRPQGAGIHVILDADTCHSKASQPCLQGTWHVCQGPVSVPSRKSHFLCVLNDSDAILPREPSQAPRLKVAHARFTHSCTPVLLCFLPPSESTSMFPFSFLVRPPSHQ